MSNLRPADPTRKIRCSRCEEWKPASDYYGKKTIQSMCKPCYNTTYNYDYRSLLPSHQTRQVVKQGVNVRTYGVGL